MGNCPAKVISNCFTHCFCKKSSNEADENGEKADNEEIPAMERAAQEHGIHITTEKFKNVLHPSRENAETE